MHSSASRPMARRIPKETSFTFSYSFGSCPKKTDWVTVKTGRKVTVSFDEPCALQIDGDVVKDVLTYSVEVDA